MQKEAAIDNDFVMHLAEIDNWSKEDHLNNVMTMFDELDVIPIMHELVYNKELCGGPDTTCKNNALSFFVNDIINVKYLSEIIDNQSKRQYYEIVFKEIYYDFKGNLPSNIKDIFKDWKNKASLGETHTVVMCFIMGCSIFLSDDDDSKKLSQVLKNKKSFKLDVYDRKKACDRIKELGAGVLNKKDRRILSHVPK